jgi:hypothetical protein
MRGDGRQECGNKVQADRRVDDNGLIVESSTESAWRLRVQADKSACNSQM